MKTIPLTVALFLPLLGSPMLAQEPPPKESADKPKLEEEKAQAASADDKQRAAAFVHQHRNDFVFIKSKDGVGSGFIALMRGRKVLVTNAHVMAALRNPSFMLLDRSTLRVGAASLALGHDLVAFVVLEGGTGIPLATAVDDESQIGDAVVVLGNADGGGVVNPLHGELVGLGPDRVEVNAPFELGNSGSPIVHLRTGNVIGVATYAKLGTLLSGKEKLRRFGYRLDSVKTWQLIDWRRFYTESDLAAKILTATFEIEDVLVQFKEIRKHNYARAYETPAIRGALETYHRVSAQGDAYTDTAAQGLLVALREACGSDLAGARDRFSYDFFRRQLTANEEVRKEIIQGLDKVLRE